MKKISLYMAAACAVFGMASCSQDRDPVLQTPTEFVLNVPVMQNQYIELKEGNVLELVCSQPNYGYSAVANYSAEISLTEDFAEFETLTPIDVHQSRMSFKQLAVATAINVLHGIEDEDTYQTHYPDGVMPYEKIYFRAVCELSGIEGTRITSNVVSYDNIKPFFAVPVPGYIYLVGSPEGWAGPVEGNASHYADWRLFEPKDAIGSKVYIGVFDLPAAPMFRFYTELTGWDDDSYGFQVPDVATDVDTPNDSYTGTLVKGKGAFNFINLPEGKYTIVVDMSDDKNITFTMTPGATEVVVAKYIYLVGSISGWNAPGLENASIYGPYRLADTTGTGIYTGSWPVSAGHVNFRFATELTEDGWNNTTQIGAAVPDEDVACNLVNGTYTGNYVSGKGNFAFDIPNDATVNITVDTNTKAVTVTFVDK